MKVNTFMFIFIINLMCCKNLTMGFSVTKGEGRGEGMLRNTGLELVKLFSICEAKAYLTKLFTVFINRCLLQIQI